MAETLQTEPRTGITAEPVRLKWSEKDRAVVIDKGDNDLYVIKVKEVIQACNIQQEGNEVESQFNDLKNILGNWVHKHKEKIDRAFVTIRDTRLLFLVTTKNMEYDSQFEDELTALDWDIANTPFLSAIKLSVLSLPCCDQETCESFLSPPIILEYVG